MTTKNLLELSIHPLVLPLDIISKAFLFEPREELIRELYGFTKSSPLVIKEIESLNTKLEKIINDNNLTELESHYLHLFELPSQCRVKAHESTYYYGRIKPEYLFPLMSPLGISFTPINGKFADHFANQLLLLAAISSQALLTSDHEEFKRSIHALKSLYEQHLKAHLQRIIDQIRECHCNSPIDIYSDLILLAQQFSEEIYSIFSELMTLKDRNELLEANDYRIDELLPQDQNRNKP